MILNETKTSWDEILGDIATRKDIGLGIIKTIHLRPCRCGEMTVWREKKTKIPYCCLECWVDGTETKQTAEK